jgi:glycosyltransferase involved in cell wall biosynthesis
MFSVVIPLYNKAHTIERTLTSVLTQTYPEFEVIIVNDGSTDNGIEVIRNLTSDTRIRIIEQNNQGVSAARNKGVAAAKYDYIAFLDGDDDWLPAYLEKMKETIALYPKFGMYCCAGIYKEKSDEALGFRIAKKYKNKITDIDFFENPHVFSHTSATIVYKEAFFKCEGFPIGIKKNEDYALFYSLALIAPVAYCGFPLSCYYGKIEGQATSLMYNKIEFDMDVIKRFNITYGVWKKLDRKNKSYKVFLKYELRHVFIIGLRDKNYEQIDLFLNNVDKEIKALFSSFEINLIKTKPYNRLAIFFILCTKIIWRTHGYPRTGIS